MASLPEDVCAISIAEQKYFNNKPFPLVLSPKANNVRTSEDMVSWVKSNKASLGDLLFEHGAILFRGFPVAEPVDFDFFVKGFDMEALPYVGGAAPRKVIVGNVFTANEAPPDQLIPFHHEMAQVPTYPKVLFFYCNVAPSEGGQTPLVLSNEVYKRINAEIPDFVDKLEKLGVVYTRVLPNGDDPNSPIGRGWQSTFQTEIRAEAEAKARDQGTSFEWLPDGCLKTITTVLPAVREDTRSGKKMWFNSIIAAYRGWNDCRNSAKKAITFSNGESMCPEAMDVVERLLNEVAVDFTWQYKDVVMVDNRQALHGRRSFTPPRRILAALCK